MKSKRTKALEFSVSEKKKIAERDVICVFCRHGLKGGTVGGYDFAHYIPRSHGGLGIEQNGFLACRGHHHMFDNSIHRKEMKPIIEGYFKKNYEDWKEENLYYKKWNM